MTKAGYAYHLLIVDDDETDRRLYGRLLSRHGPGSCLVRHAADGTAGLAALSVETPDCVLLDFHLPDMTGLEFMAGAAVEGTLPCAFVLMTGQGNEVAAVVAIQHGVEDYLAKDEINESSLYRAIASAIGRMELRRSLATSIQHVTAVNVALEQETETRKATETALQMVKDTAEQASQARTRFIAMMTYQLRTPLNGILGYAELLRMEGGLSDQQDGRVVAMMQAGRHLLETIDRALDLASIDTEKMQPRPVTIAVYGLVEGCVAFTRSMTTERAVALRVVGSPGAPRQIIGDPERLRQVLLNLLDTAVKYTNAGEVELRLLAGATSGGLRIEVTDNGPGIGGSGPTRPLTDAGRVEAEAAMDRASRGLAMSAWTVGGMGGAIGYAGIPTGGSLFWLELPSADTVVPSASTGYAAPQPTGRRVLLVDDIAMNRDVIGSFLTAAGHEVLLAVGGREAVQIASEQSLDLVLMDVRMPEMDGLEATRLIRALPHERGRVPILALTAYTFVYQVAQCREAGMDGHVTKPVNYTALVRAIDAAVARSPQKWPTEGEAEPIADEALPLLDREVLDDTLAFLPSGDAMSSLRSLQGCMQRMLRLLEQRAATPLLLDAAHTLASTAGMFGFSALSATMRHFETVTAEGAPEAEALAHRLPDELLASLAALNAVACEDRTQPTTVTA